MAVRDRRGNGNVSADSRPSEFGVTKERGLCKASIGTEDEKKSTFGRVVAHTDASFNYDLYIERIDYGTTEYT